MKNAFLITLILQISINLIGQESILLNNASFEDTPRAGRPPSGWIDCGFLGQSPSDIFPNGNFEVIEEPSDGETYIGMVVRENDTWERVGQRLNKSITKGINYYFKIDLRKPLIFKARTSRQSEKKSDFANPVILRIWGGNDYCSRAELLGETEAIENEEWKTYLFEINAKDGNWNYLTLEAYYNPKDFISYNGSILLDNCSDIINSRIALDSLLKDVSNNDFSNVQILEIIIEIGKALNLQEEISPNLFKIVKTIEFEEEVKKEGVREFVFSEDQDHILVTISLLKSMNANLSAEILERTNRILLSNQSDLSDDDIAFFAKNNKLFIDAYNEDDYQKKLIDFVLLHKDDLLKEIEKSRE